VTVVTLRVVTFKVEQYLLDLVDLYATNHGMYRSEVIRLAIKRLLEEDEKKSRREK
jgi:metal-responsive CopG/Arc/MetJ family transcriptional regulator